jgi:hypothetical protein
MTETAIAQYAYLVADSEALPALDLQGVDGAPVTRVHFGQLTALTSPVRVAPFRHAATSDVHDSSWLAGALRAHDAIASEVVQRVGVLPMRFGTMFASTTALARALAQHHDALSAELDRLGRATEWAVKIDDPSAREHAAATEPAAAPSGGIPTQSSETGTAWMLRRQQALVRRQERRSDFGEDVENLRVALCAQARDVVVTPARLSDDRRAVTLSFLVDDASAFRTAFATAQARAAGLHIRMTGPWPPYHFVRHFELTASAHA